MKEGLFIFAPVMATIRKAYYEWELTRSSPPTQHNKEFLFFLASKLDEEHGFRSKTTSSRL